MFKMNWGGFKVHPFSRMIEFIFTSFVLYAISLVIVALVLIYWWVYHSPKDYDVDFSYFICSVIFWPMA